MLMSKPRDFIEINYLRYRKLRIGKVVTQPVKIIRTLDPFKSKFSVVSKERGYGVMTKKRESKCGENSRVRDG